MDTELAVHELLISCHKYYSLIFLQPIKNAKPVYSWGEGETPSKQRVGQAPDRLVQIWLLGT